MRQPATRPAAFTLAATVAAVLAALALALPAAGSAARAYTAPGPWAEQVCAALADWSAAAELKEAALEERLNRTESLPQVRAVFSRFLDEIVRETDRMIVRVDIAGTPAVRSGPAIRQRLRALLVRARGLLADARRQAARLSLSDRASFAKSAGAIGTAVGAQFDALGGAFDQLDRAYPSPELDRAVSRAPSCKSL